MNQSDFCKEMLTILSDVICTPAEGYEKAGLHWMVHDVKELIDKYEELEAQAAAMKETFEWLKIFLGWFHNRDAGDLWEAQEKVKKALSSTAGRDLLDKINYLESQCAAYRDTLTDIKKLGPYVKVPLDLARPEELADEALSSDAGRDLLDRMQRMDKALELACEKLTFCPNMEAFMKCDLNLSETKCRDCRKDYFLHKAGETESSVMDTGQRERWQETKCPNCDNNTGECRMTHYVRCDKFVQRGDAS